MFSSAGSPRDDSSPLLHFSIPSPNPRAGSSCSSSDTQRTWLCCGVCLYVSSNCRTRHIGSVAFKYWLKFRWLFSCFLSTCSGLYGYSSWFFFTHTHSRIVLGSLLEV
ncbi:hypothetical protein D1007_47514 [Hordeum vulgare]|nr:hypothetical protein D1007_47514 [Hordeum vulgare]